MNCEAPKNIIAGGLPHVAYVLLWYPLFTQPFIFREVESLKKILPLKVYTLYDENLRHCSREMLSAARNARTHGVKAFFPTLGDLAKRVGVDSRKLRDLFKLLIWRRWPNLETLGENLWAFYIGISLGRQFKEDGIDLVYAPWPRGAATAAWVGAELADLPFGIAARGDNLDPADPDLEDKFANALFVRANNLADKLRIETFGHGHGAGRIPLLYNSLTLPPAPIDPPLRFRGSTLRLLALGRFDVTKGFDVLLKACALLKKKGVDFKLTLAGGGGKVMGLGNLEDELRRLRGTLHLEEEVEMPGLVSHDELPAILMSHDIFTAPCIIHSSGRRDGIPNTVIEAMAYGMPVVSTTVNALPEVVRNGETGLTVPPNDPEALANAICWLAEHPQKALEMGATGSLLAKNIFDPAQNAQKLADIFQHYYQKYQMDQKNVRNSRHSKP